MDEGIAAIQKAEYNNAKSIFKSGRKIARKSGQKDLKNRFKRMEDKAGSYLKFQKEIKKAERSIQLGQYLGALSDYKKAKQAINAVTAIKTDELAAYDNGLLSGLEERRIETETNRIERLESDLVEADQFFEAKEFYKANKQYDKVKKNMKKSEDVKYGVTVKFKQSGAWNALQSGDRYFAKKDYRKALAAYKKSKKAYALPTVGDKLKETTDIICSEIPTDLIGIVELGEEKVDKLEGERLLLTYSCEPSRSKMIKAANKYYTLIGKAEKIEKTNKNKALEHYRDAQKLAATDFVQQKLNKLSPKYTLAPAKPVTFTGNLNISPPTEMVFVNKSFGEFCPNSKDHQMSGNNEFGSGPYADCKLTFTHTSKKVYVDIELTLTEPNGDSKIYAKWKKELVYTSAEKINGFEVVKPSNRSQTQVVHKLVTTATYSSRGKGGGRTTMPKAGAEVWKCNEGTPHSLSRTFDYNLPDTHDMNGFNVYIEVIGDTGASDISRDRDCGCDSKIKKINISGLQVQVEK